MARKDSLHQEQPLTSKIAISYETKNFLRRMHRKFCLVFSLNNGIFLRHNGMPAGHLFYSRALGTASLSVTGFSIIPFTWGPSIAFNLSQSTTIARNP